MQQLHGSGTVVDARCLANIVWSFAMLKLPDVPLMNSIASQSIRRIEEFHTQGLANTPWAYATLLFWHWPLLHALSAQAIRRCTQFVIQECSNIAWA